MFDLPATVYIKMKKPNAAIRDASAALEVSSFAMFLLFIVISTAVFRHSLSIMFGNISNCSGVNCVEYITTTFFKNEHVICFGILLIFTPACDTS